MNHRFRRMAKIIVVFYTAVIAVLTFQNCGQISVTPREIASTEPTPLNVESVSYLKIDNSLLDIFRAVFVLDMSDSMFSGPCPDSIDVSIPDVIASPNCLGPTGVDPQGNRFEIMLDWLDDLQKKITAAALTNQQVKIMVLPFSGPDNYLVYRWSPGFVNQMSSPLGMPVTKGFVSVEVARNYLYFLWAIEAKYHSNVISSRIPLAIRNAVAASSIAGAGNFSASTGTSIVAPTIESMNQELNIELLALKNLNALGKSHFELAFFSDGVPKPHALHVMAAAKYIWARKKSVCDGNELFPANQNCENGYNSQDGIVTVDARACITRCEDYLANYADTGAVNLPGSETPTCVSHYSIPYMCSGFSDGANFSERWSSKIKCGQCFKLLSQFDYSKESPYYGFNRDNFQDKLTRIWGNWTENRHSNIIGKLKTTVNIFKIQYPGALFKMSFNRVDSSVPAYQTQAGEMVKELNWMVRAEDYFAKKHRFFTVKNSTKPYELFQELQNGQSYKLGMLYVYNRNMRSDGNGNFLADTDGDGVPDIKEMAGELTTPRSDGICLDSIKKIYGQCLSVGCDPKIDHDGDGLNQCEEATVGTDDFDADTDGDGILDGSELLFALNPSQDDQILYSNTDGFSNFEHFVKGFSALVNLGKIESNRMINISSDLVDYKVFKDARGLDVEVPGYNIKVKNLPINEGKPNEIVVVARVDNFANPNDKRWMSKTYILTDSKAVLEIKLEDLTNLKLVAP